MFIACKMDAQGQKNQVCLFKLQWNSSGQHLADWHLKSLGIFRDKDNTTTPKEQGEMDAQAASRAVSIIQRGRGWMGGMAAGCSMFKWCWNLLNIGKHFMLKKWIVKLSGLCCVKPKNPKTNVKETPWFTGGGVQMQQGGQDWYKCLPHTWANNLQPP